MRLMTKKFTNEAIRKFPMTRVLTQKKDEYFHDFFGTVF